jgi:hypothetical protein
MGNKQDLLHLISKNIIYRTVTGDTPTYGWFYACHLTLVSIDNELLNFEHTNGSTFSIKRQGSVIELKTDLPVARGTNFALEIQTKQVIRLTSKRMEFTARDPSYSALLNFILKYQQAEEVIRLDSPNGTIHIASKQIIRQEYDQPLNFQSAAHSQVEESEWFGPNGQIFTLRFHFLQCSKDPSNNIIQLEVRSEGYTTETFGIYITLDNDCIEWKETEGFGLSPCQDSPSFNLLTVHPSSDEYFTSVQSIPHEKNRQIRVYVVRDSLKRT